MCIIRKYVERLKYVEKKVAKHTEEKGQKDMKCPNCNEKPPSLLQNIQNIPKGNHKSKT